MDTFVYKAGRAAAGVLFGAMIAYGATALRRAGCAVAVCVVWGGIGAYVGHPRWRRPSKDKALP